MNKYVILAASACLAAITPVSAQAAEILAPGSSQGWTTTDIAQGGSAAITSTYIPAGPGQTGSLELNMPNASSKAVFIYSFTNGLTLGDLLTGMTSGSGVSFDFFRDVSSTATAHFAPVLRFSFLTAGGEYGELVWESVYNGGGNIAEGVWLHADLTGDNFYQRTYQSFLGFLYGGKTVDVYNKTITDYLGGTFSDGQDTSVLLGSDTQIQKVSLGVGSGWNGSYFGAVDNLSIDMGSKGLMTANFNPTAAPAAAVPEPATWLMLILGFGLIGGTMRSRRSTALRALTA